LRGGAATKTFAPGGKHPRAATEQRYTVSTLTIYFFLFIDLNFNLYLNFTSKLLFQQTVMIFCARVQFSSEDIILIKNNQYMK